MNTVCNSGAVLSYQRLFGPKIHSCVRYIVMCWLDSYPVEHYLSMWFSVGKSEETKSQAAICNENHLWKWLQLSESITEMALEPTFVYRHVSGSLTNMHLSIPLNFWNCLFVERPVVLRWLLTVILCNVLALGLFLSEKLLEAHRDFAAKSKIPLSAVRHHTVCYQLELNFILFCSLLSTPQIFVSAFLR